jgi:hypothetical protein
MAHLCRNDGQLPIFNAAHTRKPEFYILQNSSGFLMIATAKFVETLDSYHIQRGSHPKTEVLHFTK